MSVKTYGVKFPRDANGYVIPVLRQNGVNAGTKNTVNLAVGNTLVSQERMFRLCGTTDLVYAFGPSGTVASCNNSVYLPAGAIDYGYTLAGETVLSFAALYGNGGFLFCSPMN